MVAAAHICAFFSGSNFNREFLSFDVGAGFGCSSPSIARTKTRRIFTSITSVRFSKAKAAIAAAVYSPIPGNNRRISGSSGT